MKLKGMMLADVFDTLTARERTRLNPQKAALGKTLLTDDRIETARPEMALPVIVQHVTSRPMLNCAASDLL